MTKGGKTDPCKNEGDKCRSSFDPCQCVVFSPSFLLSECRTWKIPNRFGHFPSSVNQPQKSLKSQKQHKTERIGYIQALHSFGSDKSPWWTDHSNRAWLSDTDHHMGHRAWLSDTDHHMGHEVHVAFHLLWRAALLWGALRRAQRNQHLKLS